VVLSADALLTTPEIENIKSIVSSGFKNIFFVINFWDLIDHDTDNKEDPENSEAAKLMRRADSILLPIIGKERFRIFYLSAKKALLAKIKCDQHALVSSGFYGFEKSLSEFLIQDRGHAFLKQAASNFQVQARLIESAIETKELLIKKPLDELQKLQDSIQPQLNDLKQKKENILAKVRSVADRVTRSQTDKFETMLERMANSGLKNDANNWKSNQTVLLLPGQVKRCAEDFIASGERFIQQRIIKWTEKEFVPELESEIEILGREIKDDVNEFEYNIKRIQAAIRPDLGTIESGNKDSVGVSERLISAIGMLLFNPVSAVAGGVLGYKGAIVNLGSQIGAGLLLATLGILSVGTLLVAGFLIGIVQIAFDLKEKQSKIKDGVVNRYIEVIGQKSREMSRQFESGLHNFFIELHNNLEKGFNSEINVCSNQLKQIINEKAATKNSVNESLSKYSKYKEVIRQVVI
jgi:hypothetical protein